MQTNQSVFLLSSWKENNNNTNNNCSNKIICYHFCKKRLFLLYDERIHHNCSMSCLLFYSLCGILRSSLSFFLSTSQDLDNKVTPGYVQWNILERKLSIPVVMQEDCLPRYPSLSCWKMRSPKQSERR